MENQYLLPALELVEAVFTQWDSPEEGKLVRRLVEEIRRKKYHVPELEFVMANEKDEVIGYAMFSRFHIEGKYENKLLMLTPVAVKTELQRQHISRELIEYGFEVAKKLGFKTCILPDVSVKSVGKIDGIKIVGVKTIKEALDLI